MRGFLGLSLVLLVACGTKSPDTDALDTSSPSDSGSSETGGSDTAKLETGDTPEPVEPKEGNFNGALTEVLSDECGVFTEEITEAELDFWFTWAQGRVNLLVIEEGSDLTGPLVCDDTESGFSCLIEEDRDAVGAEWDAELVMQVRIDGSFSDAETIEAAVVWDFSCVGADCDAALEANPVPFDLPCLSTIGIAAAWTAEEPVMPVVPEKGRYTLPIGKLTKDECGLQAQSWDEVTAEWAVELELEAELTAYLSGLSDLFEKPVSCGPNGAEFACIVLQGTADVQDYEATLNLEFSVRGEWVEPTEVTGEVDYNISCVGPECQAAIKNGAVVYDALPCISTSEFSGSKI